MMPALEATSRSLRVFTGRVDDMGRVQRRPIEKLFQGGEAVCDPKLGLHALDRRRIGVTNRHNLDARNALRGASMMFAHPTTPDHRHPQGPTSYLRHRHEASSVESGSEPRRCKVHALSTDRCTGDRMSALYR